MKFDITALGEILIDFIPDGVDEFGSSRFLKKAGGAPVNLLAVASKIGLETAFIGKVGNDMFGDFLKETLIENKICADGLIFDDEHNTTLAFVELDENGDRNFSFYRKLNADTFLDKKDINEQIITSSKVFHFGSLSFTSDICTKASNYALEIAKKSNCIISYDPNYRDKLWNSQEDAAKVMRENLKFADIVKLSKEEAEMISGIKGKKENLLKISKDFDVKIILITDAANGVEFICNGEIGFLPSFKVKPVDTTGAGDIFFGTFLSEFLKENDNLENIKSIERYVEKAIEISGKSTLKKGAISSIPIK